MAMVKIVDPRGWDWERPVAQQIKLARAGLRGADRRAFIKLAGATAPAFLDVIDKVKFAADEVPAHVIALGATEFWGCFAAGTEVRDGEGQLQKIEAIELGTEVVTHLGRTSRVITRYQRPYSGDVCRLSVAGLLDEITCTANHPFLIIPHEQIECREDRSRQCKPATCQNNSLCTKEACSRAFVSYTPHWAHAGDIRPGDYVLSPVPDREVGKQTWRWSSELAKLIGYFTAEGSYIKKGSKLYGLSLAFNANEADTLIADLRRCVEALSGEYQTLRGKPIQLSKIYRSAGTQGVQCHIISHSLASRIFRCVGEYSGGKYLGGEFYFQSPETLRHFFAGWLDGDGTCPVYTKPNGYDEHRYTIGTKSRRLGLDGQWLLSRLGVPAALCPVYDGRFYHLSFANLPGNVFDGVAFKHRQVDPLQLKEHAFLWNGYICRPVRENNIRSESLTVYNLEVAGDHSYTVGNGVAVKNCNRNADGFKVAMLQRCHPTFVKHGRAYRNHQNKNPAISYGVIKASAYNDAMNRVELLIAYNASKSAAERNGGLIADKEIEKLARDEDLSTSMAIRVPADFCSSCQNRARTRDEYCTEETCVGPRGEKRGGCKHNLAKLCSDGHLLHVDNRDGVFFDQSSVFRPADRTAYGTKADWLAKAAAHEFPGGAALAEALAVSAPLSVCLAQDDPLDQSLAVRAQFKLAHALAQLSAQEPGLSPQALRALDPRVRTSFSDAQLALLGRPGTAKAASALAALADRKIVLGLGDFARWTKRAAAASSAAEQLAGIFTRLVSGGRLIEKLAANPWQASDATSPAQRALASGCFAGSSLDSEALAERAMRFELRRLSAPVLKTAFIKSAAADPTAAALAEDYALYQLAALQRIAGFDTAFNLTARLAVGQNRF